MLKNEDILERAEKFHGRVSGVCGMLHEAYTKDIEFGLLGKQWETADPMGKKSREGAKRITLTVNRLRQFIYQVVNDYKQAEITSKVLPHDTSEKDKMLAEVRRGIMRSLERKKGGLMAYQIAAKTLVAGGLGGWRLNTRYVDPKSFDQEPYFIPIHDMSTVLVDYELCMEPDYSDMYDCIIQEKYSPERFKSEFKKSVEDMAGGAEHVTGVYGSPSSPAISEYWYKEKISETLCALIPQASELGLGKTAYLSDLKKQAKELGFDVDAVIRKDDQGKPIQRDTERCKVYCAKIAGKQVIGDVVEWPVDLIPVVIVTGRKTVNKGRVAIEGLIRQSHDAQMSYNYLKSNIAERIALAPKAPYEVAKESIDPKDKQRWETANTKNWAYLPYRAYTKDGSKPLPPPRRTDPVSGDTALVQQEAQAVDEIKATVGMYDASIGNRSNETSGRAIQARAQEADTTNFDFTESMALGIKYSTKVLNQLIPKVFDTGRQVSMVGDDDKEKVIMVNQPGPDGTEYNLTEGDFDIDIEAGPSSATKAQQIREDLTGIMQALPAAAMVVGPGIVRNSEMRNADEYADTLERMANMQMPGLFPDKQNPNQQLPPQVVAQFQQMQAQMQQMQMQLQEAGPKLQQAEEAAHRASMENQAIKADRAIQDKKLRIDAFNADTQRIKVEQEYQLKAGDLLLKTDEFRHEVQMDHADHALQAQGLAHTQNKDAADFHGKMRIHGDTLRQDMHRMDFEREKADKDRKAKASQAKGRLTGGKPGKPPTPKA